VKWESEKKREILIIKSRRQSAKNNVNKEYLQKEK
jgi:hypothetical protein